MNINEDQLIVWTHSPGNTNAQYTYDQVKKAIESSNILNGKYEVYLQGSYANSTNIRVDSDIDIVVQLTPSWMRDISKLNLEQQQLYLSSVVNVPYTLDHFRTDILKALRAYFTKSTITEGKKSIKLAKYGNRVNADIVPCIEYRTYGYFISHLLQNHVKGIKFYTTDGIEIINYPKLHLKNGENKNHISRTNEKYKHIVRIFKNLRKVLIENHSFNPNTARSYFIECAIYNVPDPLFEGSYQTSLMNTLNFLLYQCPADSLRAANNQHLLFGPEVWQWNQDDAAMFFKSAENLVI